MPSPEVKLVIGTKPGSRADVHLEGTIPADGEALLNVAEMVLDKADRMKTGPHKTAADTLATGLMRRAGC